MIFIDRSVPKSVASALKLVRSDIAWLEDRFAHNAKDEEWIPAVAADGWPVVVRDKKIRTRPRERDLVVAHKGGFFFINQKRDPTRWEYLKIMANCLDEVERLYRDTERPFMYLIDSRYQFSRFALPTSGGLREKPADACNLTGAEARRLRRWSSA